MIRSSEGNQLYIGCTFFAINRIKIRLLSFKCHFDLSSCHKLRHILQFDGNEKNSVGHVKHSTLGNMPKRVLLQLLCIRLGLSALYTSFFFSFSFYELISINLPALSMDSRIKIHAAMGLADSSISKRYHERQPWRSLHRLQWIGAADSEML